MKDIIRHYLLNDPIAIKLIPNKTQLGRYIKQKENFDYSDVHMRRSVREVLQTLDLDLISHNVKVEAKNQRLMDSNRIERKHKREYLRSYNALEDYNKNVLEQLEQFSDSLQAVQIPTIKKNKEAKGVVQVSDVHGNELINLEHNKFDFNILSKRLYKYACSVIVLFKGHGITDVLVAFTGDLLNSDRRLDEKLNQSTNRAKATVLLQHIFTQFLLHLRQHFNISVLSVLGNEGRVDDEMSFSDNVLSNNYDFSVISMIKEKLNFAGVDITFLSIDKTVEIVDIYGQKWMFTHDLSKSTKTEKGTLAVIGGNYVSGTKVDYIVCGHIHSTLTADYSARSGSLSGSNGYSEVSLGLYGRASQNVFIAFPDGKITSRVDLQEYGEEGYDIVSRLEAYDAVSSSTKEIVKYKL